MYTDEVYIKNNNSSILKIQISLFFFHITLYYLIKPWFNNAIYDILMCIVCLKTFIGSALMR